MIDTVVLVIPFDGTNYTVTKPEMFDPPITLAEGHLKATKGMRFIKHSQNPLKITYKNGHYSPRLTITFRKARKVNKYPVDIDLKIEFSIPKLLYQNNLDELTDTDFNTVIDILHTRLIEMGILISKKALIKANVRAVHFSKNIPLTNFYTASLALKELNKLDASKWLEIDTRRFQDNGHALYFDCNSYQIVFYDKIADITQTKRHSADKEKTNHQLNLFKHFKKSKEPTEILRYELRITNKQKLNGLLKQLGYKENPTFQEIFSSKLSQKMLFKYWKVIYPNESRFMLQFDEDNPGKTFESIANYYKQSKKRVTVKDTFCQLGIITFSKSLGIRDLKATVSSTFSSRTWFRTKKLFETANLLFKNNKSFGFVKDIEDSLNLFTPFKAKDLSYIRGTN